MLGVDTVVYGTHDPRERTYSSYMNAVAYRSSGGPRGEETIRPAHPEPKRKLAASFGCSDEKRSQCVHLPTERTTRIVQHPLLYFSNIWSLGQQPRGRS